MKKSLLRRIRGDAQVTSTDICGARSQTPAGDRTAADPLNRVNCGGVTQRPCGVRPLKHTEALLLAGNSRSDPGAHSELGYLALARGTPASELVPNEKFALSREPVLDTIAWWVITQSS